jgi:hypothetical protein
MDAAITELLSNAAGLGILLFVLVAIYRIVDRVLSIAEIGVQKFLSDFERIADGIADIAETSRNR